MTVFIINGRPHIEAHNGFQAISEYEYYMAIEQGEISEVLEVEQYD
jgi:uncharacterized membrane protein